MVVDFFVSSPLAAVFFIIILSFAAAILSEKMKVSYTTILIAMGLVLSLLNIPGGLESISLDKSVILGLVVPPIIFQAAMRTRYEVFKTVQKTVVTLAVFGVVVSALITGAVLDFALGLPLVVALTFGVIVSPTDPVSVVNILKRIRAPEGLTTILESEAYLNDATAVIVYPVAISLSFSPLQSISLFTYVLGGGILVGFVISGFAELLYKQVTEPLAETTFTIVVMFGSYLLKKARL